MVKNGKLSLGRDEKMEINLMDNTPLYIQLRNILKDQIENEVWTEGTIIPSENEIAKMYHVSRVTVRQALAELAEENYLVKRPGYGTVVYRNKASLSNFTLIQSLTNEMKEMGISNKTIHANLEVIKPNKSLMKIFDLNPDEYLYNMKRIRGTEEEPVVYSNIYLRQVVEIPNDKEILYSSLYSYLTNHNIVFNRFEETISAIEGPSEILAYLEMDDNLFRAILKRERFGYNASDKLIEYSINYYNPELYAYKAQIYHHRKNA